MASPPFFSKMSAQFLEVEQPEKVESDLDSK